MPLVVLIREILMTYRKHGWELRRVLLSPTTRSELYEQTVNLFGESTIDNSPINALWFARPSTSGREAWELRLVSENPYALFHAFAAEESEEEREKVRSEMETRLAELSQSRITCGQS